MVQSDPKLQEVFLSTCNVPLRAFLGSAVVKNLPTRAGDTGDAGLNPGFGRFPWRREWLPTPVFLPGKYHQQRSLVGLSPWGHKELDMTERLGMHTGCASQKLLRALQPSSLQ